MISSHPDGSGPITGAQVRVLRTAWNLRVSQLALLMGITVTSVYRYERMETEPVRSNDAFWWHMLASLDATKHRTELQNMLILGRAHALHYLLSVALAPK